MPSPAPIHSGTTPAHGPHQPLGGLMPGDDAVIPIVAPPTKQAIEHREIENQEIEHQEIEHREIEHRASPSSPDATSRHRITRNDAPHIKIDDAPAFESLEAVVRQHTASQPNLKLNFQLMIQSLATGLPLLFLDVAIGMTAMLASAAVINLWQGHVFNPGVWKQLPAWLVIQTGLFWMHGLYPGAGVSAISEMRAIVRSAAYSCLCLASLNLIFGHLPRIEFAIFVATTFIVMAGLPLGRHLVRAGLARTSWWGIRTLMIGSRRSCEQLCRQVRARRESGLMIVGYVSDPQLDQLTHDQSSNDQSSNDQSSNDQSSNDQSSNVQSGNHQERVCPDTNRLGSLPDALLVASHYRTPIAAIASAEGPLIDRDAAPAHSSHAQRLMFQFPSLIWLDASAVFPETSNPIGEFNQRLNVPFLRFTPRLLKRTLDLTLVIPGLLLLAIPMALIAIAIKLQSPGPVFYGSPRIGQQGRRFRMWKFRSMVTDADQALTKRLAENPAARMEWDATNKLKDDPRIIPGIGRFLRSSSLDELPQLWNVLVGQMSLVGPRPVPPGEIVKYQHQYYQYSHMWPGITGLWQVSGRNDTTFETRVLLVGHYAANWSLWLDAWILVKTPLTVLTRKGAY